MGERRVDVSTTHHTIEVADWTELPGGVRVGNWADVDPDTGDPALMLLLRDQEEVGKVVAALLAVAYDADSLPHVLAGLLSTFPPFDREHPEDRVPMARQILAALHLEVS